MIIKHSAVDLVGVDETNTPKWVKLTRVAQDARVAKRAEHTEDEVSLNDIDDLYEQGEEAVVVVAATEEK